MSSPDFDSQTLAVLRGRMVRYLMRSREVSAGLSTRPPQTEPPPAPPEPPPSLLTLPSPQITLGRATKDNQIDVDLALEGPAWKISRKQGGNGGAGLFLGGCLWLCSPLTPCCPPSRCHQTEEQRGFLHRQRGPAPHLHRRAARAWRQQVEAQQQLGGGGELGGGLRGPGGGLGVPEGAQGGLRGPVPLTPCLLPADRQPPLRLPHQPGPDRAHQGGGGQAGPAVTGGGGGCSVWPPPSPTQRDGEVPPASPAGLEAAGNKVFYSTPELPGCGFAVAPLLMRAEGGLCPGRGPPGVPLQARPLLLKPGGSPLTAPASGPAPPRPRLFLPLPVGPPARWDRFGSAKMGREGGRGGAGPG
uniref:Uncharacterized protein n=1 Tax=Anser brachyrhynchus TaxID=132585 RepID=A0A8B9BJR1_9AVES